MDLVAVKEAYVATLARKRKTTDIRESGSLTIVAGDVFGPTVVVCLSTNVAVERAAAEFTEFLQDKSVGAVEVVVLGGEKAQAKKFAKAKRRSIGQKIYCYYLTPQGKAVAMASPPLGSPAWGTLRKWKEASTVAPLAGPVAEPGPLLSGLGTVLMVVGMLVAVGGIAAQLFSPHWTIRFFYALLTAGGYGLFVLGRHWNADRH